MFLRAGLHSPIVGSILVGAINLGFTAAAAPLMDARGRKPLLLASFLGMAAALAAVAAVAAAPGEGRPRGVGALAAAGGGALRLCSGRGMAAWQARQRPPRLPACTDLPPAAPPSPPPCAPP